MTVDILVPIFICVVLPVSIVAIINLRKRNSDNKRAIILIKAIESGRDVNTDKLAEALKKQYPTAKEVLYARLLRGCMYSLIGIAVLVSCLFANFSFSDSDSYLVFLIGLISLAIGIAYLIVYFVTRRHIYEDKKAD